MSLAKHWRSRSASPRGITGILSQAASAVTRRRVPRLSVARLTKRWAQGGAAAIVVPFPGAASSATGEPLSARVARVLRWLGSRRNPQWGIGLLALVLSIAAYSWYAAQGLTLAYGDAISHMLIARRVLISNTPGLAQLGSVWPPLTHILMLPVIWIEPLYRSGLAGALPSMMAYVLGAIYMYRLAALCCSSRAAGAVGALALMLNPSVLYMQSTPMTEMPLIATAVVAIYYAVRWARTFATADLVKCAAAAAAGTLIRYDAWVLAIALAALLGAIAWRRHGWPFAEASGIVFAALGFAGCAAWLLYNQVIFGSALYFATGPYSSAAQQKLRAEQHLLPTQGDALLSFQAYGFATLDSAGWVIALVALLGVGWWLMRRRLATPTLPAYAVLVPFAFNWLSLAAGGSTLQTGELDQTYFNNRYGLVMLPAIALFVAFFAAQHRLLQVASLVLIAGFSIIGVFMSTPYALEDPLHGVVAPGRTIAPALGQRIASQCSGGDILLAGNVFGTAMFYSGLPDQQFITEANSAQYLATLAHPEQRVVCILVDTSGTRYDPVWSVLGARSDWRSYFSVQTRTESAVLYVRTAPGNQPTTAQSATMTAPAVAAPIR